MTTFNIDVTATPAEGLPYDLAASFVAWGKNNSEDECKSCKVDLAGNIDVPGKSAVTIIFHLKTTSVAWTNTNAYALAFADKPIAAWSVLEGKKSTYDLAAAFNSPSYASARVSTTFTPQDRIYVYSLAFVARQGSEVRTLRVDPRIRNGDGPVFSSITLVAGGIGIAIGIVLSAWFLKRRAGQASA